MTEKLLEEILHQQRAHAEDLKEIKETLNTIAVQDERIRQVESQTGALWQKYDALTAQDGIVARMREYQASCPRKEVDNLRKMFWGMILGSGSIYIGLLALMWRLFTQTQGI